MYCYNNLSTSDLTIVEGGIYEHGDGGERVTLFPVPPFNASKQTHSSITSWLVTYFSLPTCPEAYVPYSNTVVHLSSSFVFVLPYLNLCTWSEEAVP